ncbi:MAG: SDR family oxidoreductase [Verrucomicrobia bacterium]|nr:SDR family oxidoreductase [Verrucomicrobiota bacterium]MBV8276056.1 SDR family oxidoreductase [Verrucomicrobiota bacterium]
MPTTKTAIVTGASQGIGAGLVGRFLEEGYNVVGTSRSVTKSTNLTASSRLALVDGDIGDPKTAQRISDTAIERFGRIDVLVNNAGIFVPKPFTEYTSEDFNTLVSTIVGGFFYITQNAVRQMLQQQSGHIVNISTTLVDQPMAGAPCALQLLTKGSLHSVTRALAIEYAAKGIRINTIAPGVVNTPMHENDDHEMLGKLHPIHRLAEVSEIVDAVFYLNGATFVTGEILHIDGGAHAGRW